MFDVRWVIELLLDSDPKKVEEFAKFAWGEDYKEMNFPKEAVPRWNERHSDKLELHMSGNPLQDIKKMIKIWEIHQEKEILDDRTVEYILSKCAGIVLVNEYFDHFSEKIKNIENELYLLTQGLRDIQTKEIPITERWRTRPPFYFYEGPTC